MTSETRDLDSSYSQKKIYMNLQRTIISSLVNKNYCCIVILFLCYVFPFVSKDFVFPLLRWSILDFKLERIKKKKKKSEDFSKHIVSDGQIELILNHNVLLFDVLIILIHHFVLFSSILNQKKTFYFKSKNNTQSRWMASISYFMAHEHIF